jgi:hypothetical protein
MEKFCWSTALWITFCALLSSTVVCAAAMRPVKAESSTPDHGIVRAWCHPPPAEYERAARALPEFCRQWNSKLREREKDRSELIEWHNREGWKTASYRGYGPIQSCTCKLRDGVPVAEITYKTIEYYLAGHTVEQARQAHPIVAGSTNTTEIIRWNDGKWDYQ